MAETQQVQETPAAAQSVIQAGEEDVSGWVRGRARSAIEGHSDQAEPTEEKPEETEKKLEEKKVDEPEKDKKVERLDKGFAELKQRRKELARKERTIQGREMTLGNAQRELHEERELLKTEPYEWMRKHGLSARDIAKRAVDEQQTPEQEALRELKAANERMQKELEELRTHRQQTEEQTEEQKSISIVAGAIKDDAESYPFLSDEDPREVLRALETVYEAEYKPAGIQMNSEMLKSILGQFETNLRTKAEQIAARLAQKQPAGTQVPSERGNGAVQSAKPEATTEAPLSNLDAGARATPPRPLTRAEREARAANLLRFI